MIGELEKQFIEAAARTLFGQSRQCAVQRGTEQQCPDRTDGMSPWCSEHHVRIAADHDMQYPPPDLETPDRMDMLQSARLWGALEQANGCGLRKIIETAYAAQEAGPGAIYIRCMSTAGIPSEFVAEFASAIALEAIGAGVSWFDTHERFTLPDSDGDCMQCNLPRGGYHDMTVEECSAKPDAPKGGCRAPSDHHTFVAGVKPFVVPKLSTEEAS